MGLTRVSALSNPYNLNNNNNNISGCYGGGSGSYSPYDNFIRFNATTLDKDIGVSVDGDSAIVRKAKNRRRDRYVLVDMIECLGQKLFEFTC